MFISRNKLNINTYSARAAGFHEEGTSFFTFSERVMLVLSNSTVYNVMNHPSKARFLVEAASLDQLFLISNMLLNWPDGIFPDKDSCWLKCSDICNTPNSSDIIQTLILSHPIIPKISFSIFTFISKKPIYHKWGEKRKYQSSSGNLVIRIHLWQDHN